MQPKFAQSLENCSHAGARTRREPRDEAAVQATTLILGGGVSGLAAGIASGLPVCEAEEHSGGICSSYYLRPGERERHGSAPDDGEAYRFEIGGGHWIFGGDPLVLRFLDDLAPMQSYARRSAVYFRESDTYVPFPLQENLRFLPQDVAAAALVEMARPGGSFRTMAEWLEAIFGPTLCRLFFLPFHQLYTAGLCEEIAPQDAYKSPVDLGRAIQGAFVSAPPAGYNITYVYPRDGLNVLARNMANRADLRYGKRVVRIDPRRKELEFADGSATRYRQLIGTLPLNRMLELADIRTEAPPDPYTAVLVLNIGAVRGAKCPSDHWLYNPDAKSGFHRVGFYSNVDHSFLPRARRSDRVSLYVERAYVGGNRPSAAEVTAYQQAVERELQEWDFIGEVEVNDPTWIDVAYTWTRPGSQWRREAMQRLQEHDIFPVGRYGRWIFQGIADSVRDGFIAGGSFRAGR
jgi:protoporphyrinogen oxidase